MIDAILARADNGVIGVDGQLPWHLPADLKRFKALTMGRAMVMGRKTFESFPSPLPGRRHIVLTRSTDWQAEGAEVAHAPAAALALERRFQQRVAVQPGDPRRQQRGDPAFILHQFPCRGLSLGQRRDIGEARRYRPERCIVEPVAARRQRSHPCRRDSVAQSGIDRHRHVSWDTSRTPASRRR